MIQTPPGSSTVPTVVVVDDDPVSRRHLVSALEQTRVRVIETDRASKLLAVLDENVGAICLAIGPGKTTWGQLSEELRSRGLDVAVVLVGDARDADDAQHALKGGAHEFFAKPFDSAHFARVAQRAAETHDLANRLRTMRTELERVAQHRRPYCERCGPRDSIAPAARQSRPPRSVGSSSIRPAQGDEVMPLREMERRAIARAMQATGGRVGKAARLLGMGRATLYRRLADLELPTAAEPPPATP